MQQVVHYQRTLTAHSRHGTVTTIKPLCPCSIILIVHVHHLPITKTDPLCINTVYLFMYNCVNLDKYHNLFGGLLCRLVDTHDETIDVMTDYLHGSLCTINGFGVPHPDVHTTSQKIRYHPLIKLSCSIYWY